jgi:Tfp pilus assembly pilus retraction ATPase PilT
MRDPTTAAINAAATGHLVISTLHANTAAEVVNPSSVSSTRSSAFAKLQGDCVVHHLPEVCARTGGGRVPILEMMFNDIKPINTLFWWAIPTASDRCSRPSHRSFSRITCSACTRKEF